MLTNNRTKNDTVGKITLSDAAAIDFIGRAGVDTETDGDIDGVENFDADAEFFNGNGVSDVAAEYIAAGDVVGDNMR